jgi:hypothetical protein
MCRLLPYRQDCERRPATGRTSGAAHVIETCAHGDRSTRLGESACCRRRRSSGKPHDRGFRAAGACAVIGSTTTVSSGRTNGIGSGLAASRQCACLIGSVGWRNRAAGASLTITFFPRSAESTPSSLHSGGRRATILSAAERLLTADLAQQIDVVAEVLEGYVDGDQVVEGGEVGSRLHKCRHLAHYLAPY